ncbi:probable ATP-dependent RNA helicase DBP10 [Cephalotrichum gorgonifer]|uniref:RNA helicase n=1 Tax=Cephalotrichum gorgonifer TaxID=2041049 RepID=A0AAE8MR78_9PEZI|nr:probable ATP-dependent RNA helicase DBP10 [Cephalotrichum gorgonifer]
MPRRAASPAMSDAEFDIGTALFTDDVNEVKPNKATTDRDGFSFDAEGIFNDGDGSDNDEAFIALKQAASFRKTTNVKGKSVKKGGGFQAMGLSGTILRAITKKGFTVPTPIQRKTIPLILSRKDVVGMARTGSGKTAAFVIPMIERLKEHSVRIGARALIMSPSRELAIQTLKVVKELGKGTDLKTVLLVGGDSLEEQFGLMTTNPDIIIATPGRFLHLKVEMSLDVSSIRYVVFDEADRLFEMGFATQLSEILHSLPSSRQTLLFSATLPASLVEFANAGLQDPSLIRLDAESKVSPDLHSAFFSINGSDKDGALLHVLQDVIKMPLGRPEGVSGSDDKATKKRKRDYSGPGKPTEHSTIVFAATKHRVEYLQNLLTHAGFAVSYVYGALAQEARRTQVEDFRHGRTNILVVTDVAARGIDIPILQNVINYDFPPQPKIFVHRVGRTARAGQQGWSYSLVRGVDAPYLLDLQLFLGRRIVVGQEQFQVSFTDDVILGSLPRADVGNHVAWVNKVVDDSMDMTSIRRVADKADKLYMRTRNSASSESAKRAKDLVNSDAWSQLNLKFGTRPDDDAYTKMLASISSFKPTETIFEIGRGSKTSNENAAEVMKMFRQTAGPRRAKKEFKKPDEREAGTDEDEDEGDGIEDGDDADQIEGALGSDLEDDEVDVDAGADSESDLEVTVSTKPGKSTSFQDPDVYMGYEPRVNTTAEDRAYGVHTGGTTAANFVLAAQQASMDLTNDEGSKTFGVPSRRSLMRWDKKSKKYVSRVNDLDGSKGEKMVMGESGVKIAASFQSGRFEKWKKSQRVSSMPRTGDMEKSHNPIARGFEGGGPRYRHVQTEAPKEADKYRDDYEVRKKRVKEARENRVGRFRDGPGSRGEVKGADAIKMDRREKEKRREKNARGGRGGGRGGSSRGGGGRGRGRGRN